MTVISAWALALSVQQYRAMRRPQRVGQTTGSSHASFYMFLHIINQLDSSVGNLENGIIIMNDNKLLKIFCILAFLAFAAVPLKSGVEGEVFIYTAHYF